MARHTSGHPTQGSEVAGPTAGARVPGQPDDQVGAARGRLRRASPATAERAADVVREQSPRPPPFQLAGGDLRRRAAQRARSAAGRPRSPLTVACGHGTRFRTPEMGKQAFQAPSDGGVTFHLTSSAGV